MSSALESAMSVAVWYDGSGKAMYLVQNGKRKAFCCFPAKIFYAEEFIPSIADLIDVHD